MIEIPDLARWYVVRLTVRSSPRRVAQRLGIRTTDLARVCAGFPVSRRVARAVIGAFTVATL